MIRTFTNGDLPFLDYELDEAQHRFTRLPKYSIMERNDASDPQKRQVSIIFEDVPVGYFVLDEGDDKYSYTHNKNAVLIRSLSLNPRHQGKGIAKQAMLDITPYVKENFTNADELVLAVNFKNLNAYYLYLKCGFQDLGGVTEGRNGPQHILIKRI